MATPNVLRTTITELRFLITRDSVAEIPSHLVNLISCNQWVVDAWTHAQLMQTEPRPVPVPDETRIPLFNVTVVVSRYLAKGSIVGMQGGVPRVLVKLVADPGDVGT